MHTVSPRDRVGLGVDLPPHLHQGLCDFIARESLQGRQLEIDDVVETLLRRTLDAADRGEYMAPEQAKEPLPVVEPPADSISDQICDDVSRALGARRSRSSWPGRRDRNGQLAARAAHDEGISYRDAAARFGVSLSNVGYHFRRLYPEADRSTGFRSRAVHFDGGGKAGSGEPGPRATQQEAATPDQGASLAVGNVAEPQRGPRTYARAGHPPSSDSIAIAAGLRERIDALDIEIKEWEQLRAELDRRIARNIADSIVLKERLAAARRERAA